MENSEIESNKKNGVSVQKILIAILAFLVAGGSWFIYKQNQDIVLMKKAQDTMVTQKAVLLSDLEKQKDAYDTAINENSLISADLAAERAKVVQLITEVKKLSGTDNVNGLSQIKKKYSSLEQKYKELMAQNEALKVQNLTLTTQRDSTVAVLGETQKQNTDLATKNTELSSKALKAEKLTIVGIDAKAYKVKSSGKLIDTDKASATDMIEVSFTIPENIFAKAGAKSYCVQLIDSNNNIAGEKRMETFGSKSITYSAKTVVNYANKTIKVKQEILCKYLTKGTFIVNIYDQGELVSNSTFTLR